jgi:uncharacterized protein YcbK (DUF882 family)
MSERLSEHFTSTELACPCCGEYPIERELLLALETLRSAVSKHFERETPLYINSGYRCRSKNERVGGARFSQHMYGRAADVRLPEGLTPEEFLVFGKQVIGDKGGIGLYDTFMHVDVRGHKARWGPRMPASELE